MFYTVGYAEVYWKVSVESR